MYQKDKTKHDAYTVQEDAAEVYAEWRLMTLGALRMFQHDDLQEAPAVATRMG